MPCPHLSRIHTRTSSRIFQNAPPCGFLICGYMPNKQTNWWLQIEARKDFLERNPLTQTNTPLRRKRRREKLYCDEQVQLCFDRTAFVNCNLMWRHRRVSGDSGPMPNCLNHLDPGAGNRVVLSTPWLFPWRNKKTNKWTLFDLDSSDSVANPRRRRRNVVKDWSCRGAWGHANCLQGNPIKWSLFLTRRESADCHPLQLRKIIQID